MKKTIELGLLAYVLKWYVFKAYTARNSCIFLKSSKVYYVLIDLNSYTLIVGHT